MTKIGYAALLAAVIAAPAQAVLVLPNAPGGDSVTTNPVAVGTTGWYYQAGGGGTVGIQGAYPRNGNGSVRLSTATMSSYAQMGYYPDTPMGALASLSSFGYDWYRSSASVNAGVQAPAMAVYLDVDGDLTTPGDYAFLVYEPAYNGGGVAPTDTWVSAVIGASTNLWLSGPGIAADPDGSGSAYDDTLAEWAAANPSAAVAGFVMFGGAGWDAFDGAVDMATWTFAGGATTTTNFELAGAVPEPSALALAALAGLGAGFAARRRRKAA